MGDRWKGIDISTNGSSRHERQGVGERLGTGLSAIAADGGIDHVRGLPAIFGAVLRNDPNAMVVRDAMLRHGVITRAIGTDTVTFCPPLVTTDTQIDRIVDVFADVLG